MSLEHDASFFIAGCESKTAATNYGRNCTPLRATCKGGQGFLTENPFKFVKAHGGDLTERQEYVSAEVVRRVIDAARRLGVRPRDITDLFYRRQLRDDLCPIVGGRRLITESYLGMVAQVLRRNGKPCDHHTPEKGTN